MSSQVTVIIPFYNSNKYLDECLDSIFAQTLMPERIHIVVDHGSEKPLIHNIDKINVIHISNNNSEYSGAGACRLIGFNNCKTKYVAFLDADDVWKSDRIESHINYMDCNDLSFSYAGFDHFSKDLNLANTSTIKQFSSQFNVSNFLSKKITIGCLTVLVNRQNVKEIYMKPLKRRNDYQMWSMIFKSIDIDKHKNCYFDRNVGFHRLHSASLTSSKVKSIFYQYKLYREIGLPRSKSFLYLICYMFFTILSRYGPRS